MCFGKAYLPWQTCMLNTCFRRCTCTSIITTYNNFIGVNTKEISQNHHLDEGFDLNYLYPDARYSIENGHSFTGNYVVNNEQRDVGVITGSAIAKQYGEEG